MSNGRACVCLVMSRTDPVSGHPVRAQAGKVHRTGWHPTEFILSGQQEELGICGFYTVLQETCRDYISGCWCSLLCHMEATVIHVWGLWDSGNLIFHHVARTGCNQGKQCILFPKAHLWWPQWFQIGKGVHRGCILSPCLLNLYAEHIRNARLD